MLAYMARPEDKNKAASLLEAAKRIIKDRKGAYSLTTKTQIDPSSGNCFMRMEKETAKDSFI